MSEIPERIEREMFEIRSRMAPDVRDLRRHVEPRVVVQQTKEKAKARLKEVLSRLGRSIAESARRQARMAREAGRKRDPALLTDAVRSDPRPMILLAVALAATAMAVRRLSGGGAKR
ncbi:hypothetical protein Rxycam_02235 [Rubrobacter xylanophilus DSM 9941]|uniref:DUF3618 domain-containing protein n=1 Tax=Rubrobacter xylanophilus TaxID=49319 RepID=A0A510HJV4_9ACTN|nr:DUF3618 domain-containing protein [Rubrobacter xylanophilus]QYJ16402.1 hypothetical protein Rxycam_02235 [Rubrobacter xylanophilus DSM 9941]BBL80299.1 hypothetical protein RxyAA322_21530 [Rubrobacter xylanophilus]